MSISSLNHLSAIRVVSLGNGTETPALLMLVAYL